MGGFSRAVKKMVGLRNGRFKKAWNYNTKAQLIAPPSVTDIDGDGNPEIIFGTTKGDLIVLDMDAKERWRYSIHERLDAVESMFLDQDVIHSINSPPVLHDIDGDGKPEILFGTEAGTVFCLDTQGQLKWEFETKSGIRGGLLVEDVNGDGKPEIVFGTTAKLLYLLDNQGKEIERFEQLAPIESTPGYHEGQIIFGTGNGEIISISPDGEPKWTFKTGAAVMAAPAFTQLKDGVDCVIIGSTDNNLYCLDTDGELVWTYETGGAIYAKAAIADLNKDHKPEIVIGSCDNNVHAVTIDGERYWTYETDFWVMSAPIVADIDGDGRPEVVAGSYDHNIYILDSEGSYLLDYMPGLSGVVQQTGHYSEIMTQEPGQHVGKKLWQFKTDGVIVGCAQLGNGRGLVVSTKRGIIDELLHSG
ncbi:MAG: PQQ-binding-like beta-propeller repeat protein [Candidatus Woesearchaeota archaeon]